MTKSEQPLRTIEKSLEIAAPPEAVWKALTDAEELARWFPLFARVKPGVGGSIWISWGKDWWEDEGPIELWEPNKHLRWRWGPPPDPKAPAASTCIDFHLEGKGGTTILRVVHAGFGHGASWDEQYDGVSRGWNYELGSLKHYLERHRGTPRRVAFARRVVAVPFETAWKKIMSSDGILAEGKLEGTKAGDRYTIQTSAGDHWQGTVQIHRLPTDLAVVVENLQNSLFRVHVDTTYKGDGRADIGLWMATWGVPDREVDSLRGRLEAILARLFPD
jgi:uncharacterized protein YndB with AHSA1/START domain